MKTKTPRKKEIEPMTEDGFTKMELTTNMSLPCWHCKAKPKKFLHKAREGKPTEIYCPECPRG